ncbi:MAG: hypothetical protein IJM47_06835 [Synergistaceae bacterium]|nr:hypothetical protein [Synergistaceae bacterium]
MRKILTLTFILVMIGTSYGAVSNDVYVRKDVFEVYMRNISDTQERILQKLDRLETSVADLSNRVSELAGRVDGIDKRMDILSSRIDDLRNGIYLWLVAIGLVVSWPKVREIFRNMGSSSPSITLEDVKRLIAENNAELLKTLKA